MTYLSLTLNCVTFKHTGAHPMFIKGNLSQLSKERKFPFQNFRKCMVNTSNGLNILKEFKITPTENRLRILSHIFVFTEVAFSPEDIMAVVVSTGFVISKTNLNNILRLFVARGLILTTEAERTLMRGRPRILYIVSPKVLSLAS
jgi:hypothetical protein